MQREIDALQLSLQEYRENGLNSAKTEAALIAEELKIERTLPEERWRTKARKCHYEGREKTVSTPEERLKRDFFTSY